MLQELDTREADGITVTLYWDGEFRRTLIHLVDDSTDTSDLFHVPAYAAANAFDHPFCYREGS